IVQLQDYFNCMEDLETHTWVLGEDALPSTNARRVAIDKGLSVQLTFNPSEPRKPCGIQILGNEQDVKEYRDRWSNNLAMWDSNLLPRENIKRLLGIDAFPQREHSVMFDQLNLEC